MFKAWYDGSDTVVAESAEDAAAVWNEFMGAIWSEVTEAEGWEWTPRSGSITVRFSKDEGGLPQKFQGMPGQIEVEDTVYIKADCDEWAKFSGRGWLCSENI